MSETRTSNHSGAEDVKVDLEDANGAPVKIDTAVEDEDVYPKGLTLYGILASLVLIIFLMMLDTSIVATAIPRITTQFHSLEDVGWYGSAFLLSTCALQPLAGKIYAQFSYKYTFLSFFAVFELGSLLCGVSVSSTMFIIGRAVAGLGSAGLMNGGFNILSASVPLQKRPMYLGILMSISQLGVLVGPLIGGALTEYTTWKWCFLINLPIGGVAAIIMFFTPVPHGPSAAITDKARTKTLLKTLDLFGFVLFAPAIIQYLLALQWGGVTHPWSSATIIGLFCGATCTLLVFLAWEYYKGDEAMVPLSMLRQRIFWSSCLTQFFTFSAFFCINYYLPIYFQAVRDASPTMSGVDMLPSIISQMIFAIISGHLVTRVGYYLPFTIVCGVFTTVSYGLLSTLTPHTSTGKWVGYQILGGAARGCGVQMPIIAIQNLLPKSQSPVAMSLLIFSQTFGGALFLAFAQTTFNTGLASLLTKYAPSVSPELLQEAGATGIRRVVDEALLPAVLVAYNQSITRVYYLSVGCAAASIIACLGMGWKSIKKSKVTEAQVVEEKNVAEA